MRKTYKYALMGLALCGLASPALAQSVVRLPSANANSPIVQAVTVPPGYTTYYISGTPAVFIDGREVRDAKDFETLKAFVDEELEARK